MAHSYLAYYSWVATCVRMHHTSFACYIHEFKVKKGARVCKDV